MFRKRLHARFLSLSLILAMLLLSFPIGMGSVSAAASEFEDVIMNTTTPRQFDMVELTFNLSTEYDNPFNPEEADVRALVTTPSQGIHTVPAFYKSPTGPNWAVRYTPNEQGLHTVVLKVTDVNGTGTSLTYSFDVNGTAPRDGFMQKSGDRLVSTTGKQLVLQGFNFPYGHPDVKLQEMGNYAANGLNFIRLWMNNWPGNYALEWKGGTTQNGIYMMHEGIGRYQLENAARTDELLREAEKQGVYMMMTVHGYDDFHNQFHNHAYNAANGGPLTWTPQTTSVELPFWTDATAISYQKKLLRYMFARYGYSPAFGMLEYWNELDNRLNTSVASSGSWHAEIDAYWKSIDFYNHPTTTSFAWKDHASQTASQLSWHNLGTLDVANVHLYGIDAPWGAEDPYVYPTDVRDWWEQNLKSLKVIKPDSPVFVAEYIYKLDPESIEAQRLYHDGVWSPIFRAGAVSGNLPWAWSNPNNAADEVYNPPQPIRAITKVFADFMRPELYDLPTMPLVDYGLQSNDTKVGSFQSNERAILWISDMQAEYQVVAPRTVAAMSFTLPSMAAGTYDVSYVNTVTGDLISATTTTASGGNVTLSIPDFSRDVAIRVVRQGSEAVDTAAPTVPSNLSVLDVTESSISIGWTHSADNIGVTGYDVLRDSTVLFSNNPSVQFSDTGLTGDTSYTYTIRARDAAGNISSAATITTSTDPIDSVPPTVPGNVRFVGKSDSGVLINWDASTDNVAVTGYEIYRGATLAGSTSSTTLAFTDTGLTPETEYSYTIKAKDLKGNVSGASTALHVTTSASDVNFLLNPGFETAAPNGWQVADWSCGWSCLYETSEKRTGNASIKVIDSNHAWFSVYQDVPVTAGNTYTFDGYIKAAVNNGTTLRAYAQYFNASGSMLTEESLLTITGTTGDYTHFNGSVAAPPDSVRARFNVAFQDMNATFYMDDFSLTNAVYTDTETPTAPTGLLATAKSETSVTLSWDAASDNEGVTSYDIYRGEMLVGSTDGVTLSYTDSGLAMSATYSYTVHARDATGNVSSAAGPLEVTTNTPGETNFLVNPGFEASSGGGNPIGWVSTDPDSLAVSTSIKHSGNASLKVEYKDKSGYGVSQSIANGQEHTFTLTGFVHIPKLTGNSKVDVRLQFLNANGTVISQAVAGSFTKKTQGWVEVTTTATAPVNTTSVSVDLAFLKKGTVYLDDFSLTSVDAAVPSAPADLLVSGKSRTTIDLVWTASTDNAGVTGYDVYRDGVLIGSTLATSTQYADSGLIANTTYTYSVAAKDASGNTSSESSELVVTTDSMPTSILLNPGFELDNGAGDPSEWTLNKPWLTTRDTVIKHSGDASLKVVSTGLDWFGISQTLAGEVGQSYTIDGYVNITEIIAGTQIRTRVQFLNGANAVISEHTLKNFNSLLTDGWEYVSGTFTAPAGTEHVRVEFYFIDLQATVYFDDFTLTPN